MKHFLFLFLVFYTFIGFSQEYISSDLVKNVRVSQVKNKIHILYDLGKLKKINNFSIEVFYSSNNGRTYHKINDATGAIGTNIYFGNNKKIIWSPTQSTFGIVGSYDIKILATKYYTGTTVFLNYSIGAAFYNDDSRIQKLKAAFCLRKTNTSKGYFITYLGAMKSSYNFLSVYGYRSTSEYAYEYHSSNSSNCEGLSIGIGYMSPFKHFSIYGGTGLAKIVTVRLEEKIYIMGEKEGTKEISDSDKSKVNGPFVEAGMQIKLLGPFGVPIEVTFIDDNVYYSIGLSIIF